MSAKKKVDTAVIDQLFIEHVHNIVPVNLESEMRKSFIDYAMSVITDRALPDVRDGLKPVHRRILYSMFSQGFTPDKAHRKCATTVGDVIGRFHPHGDAAVYDAQVRLAQDFSMRETLVDGHGNFGSRDGDAPAAYRYTEARLTKIAMEMMSDINKNTVDFRPNYDEHEMEPVVLPARFPNLLVNGSTGIAVGMATNIPPHNLAEVIDGTIHLLHNPEASVEDLFHFIPGPDFPTGGNILGVSGIREAYRTGRGRIVVRATAEIEEMGQGRQKIIVRDLPYQVNKARLIEKIDELVKQKRLDGISFVRDESDRNEEIRIVIELKRDANANVVLNQLYKNTQMQDSFGANMLALVPNEKGVMVPQVIDLLTALSFYIEHQKDVVRRRTRFDLEKAELRRHLIEGLRLAIDHIDEVISIIRASMTEDEAKHRLCERFNFSERQAQHIVDMRLGRLTGLERDKLDREHQELLNKIADLTDILEREQRLRQVIEEELTQIKTKYGNPRRSQIDVFAEDISDESLIAEEQVVLTKTHFGYVKRLPLATYESQHRGGRGVNGMQTREEDFVDTILSTSTHDTILFFTNTGRVFRLKAYQIPEGGRQAKGMAIVNLLQLEAGEKIQTMIPIHSFDEGGYLMMATSKGQIKKTRLDAYANINKSGLIAISLREDDHLIGVRYTQGDGDLLLVTSAGMGIRFSETEVRETGRNTQGVRGINLRGSDSVVVMVPVQAEAHFVLISEHGFGKRIAFDEFRCQSRAGMGVRAYACSDKTGALISGAQIEEEQDLILVNDAGVIIRIAASEIPVLSRQARGVTLMRSSTAKVVDLAVVDREDERETVDDGAEEVVAEEVSSDVKRPAEASDGLLKKVEGVASKAEDLVLEVTEKVVGKDSSLDRLMERLEDGAQS